MAPGIPLRLIGTSDLHAYIYPYDYYRDRPDETVGLAKTAALISAARGEATNSLLLDNGDFLQAPRSATMPPNGCKPTNPRFILSSRR